MKKLRRLWVDDRALLREGRRVLRSLPSDLAVVAAVGEGGAAVEAARTRSPDIVLMDLRLPGLGGVEAPRRLKAAQPAAPVIVHTTSGGGGRRSLRCPAPRYRRLPVQRLALGKIGRSHPPRRPRREPAARVSPGPRQPDAHFSPRRPRFACPRRRAACPGRPQRRRRASPLGTIPGRAMLGLLASAVLLSFTRRFFVFFACGASSKKRLPPEIPVAAGPRGSPRRRPVSSPFS